MARRKRIVRSRGRQSTPAVRTRGNESKAGWLYDAEKAAILTALRALDGNVQKAAERLGCSKKKVYTRMKEYGVSPKRPVKVVMDRNEVLRELWAHIGSTWSGDRS